MREEDVLKKFMLDVQKHEMTVLMENGVYRSVEFRNPDRSTHSFTLTTWPGHLCISGDCETYVFSRLNDMFDFFRTDQPDINIDYWMEKLVAPRSRDILEFDEDAFEQYITEAFEAYWDTADAPKAKEECWDRIESDVLGHMTETDAEAAAAAFEYKGFRFSDIWEVNFKEPPYSLIWAMHAINWGIRQYDIARTLEKEQEQEAAPRSLPQP